MGASQRRRSGLGLVTLFALALSPLVILGPSRAAAQVEVLTPNIIVIMTDDQPVGQLDAMPFVQANIFDKVPTW